MARCFYCGEPDVLLLDRCLRNSLPRDCGVIDMKPCAKCAGLMKAGIILITVDAASMEEVDKARRQYLIKKDMASEDALKRMGPFIPNPVRTGGWFVITENAMRRVFAGNEQLLAFAFKRRWMFIEEEAARAMGLYDVAPVCDKVEDAIKKGNEDVQQLAEVPGEQGTQAGDSGQACGEQEAKDNAVGTASPAPAQAAVAESKPL